MKRKKIEKKPNLKTFLGNYFSNITGRKKRNIIKKSEKSVEKHGCLEMNKFKEGKSIL